MNIKLQVLFYGICAYSENGIARFCYKNLDWFGSKNTITRNIEKLINENLLEKII